MNTIIIIEWFQAFYTFIGLIQQVLLTIDNFFTYILVLEFALPLANIRIV